VTEAFHPFTDADNLEPVKRMAQDLAQQADKWDLENLPEKVNNNEIRAKIIQLKEDTRALSDMIKNDGSDHDIGVSINAIHERLHKIMEVWHVEAGERLQ